MNHTKDSTGFKGTAQQIGHLLIYSEVDLSYYKSF